jgi:hypothetical protein
MGEGNYELAKTQRLGFTICDRGKETMYQRGKPGWSYFRRRLVDSL